MRRKANQKGGSATRHCCTLAPSSLVPSSAHPKSPMNTLFSIFTYNSLLKGLLEPRLLRSLRSRQSKLSGDVVNLESGEVKSSFCCQCPIGLPSPDPYPSPHMRDSATPRAGEQSACGQMHCVKSSSKCSLDCRLERARPLRLHHNCSPAFLKTCRKSAGTSNFPTITSTMFRPRPCWKSF